MESPFRLQCDRTIINQQQELQTSAVPRACPVMPIPIPIPNPRTRIQIQIPNTLSTLDPNKHDHRDDLPHKLLYPNSWMLGRKPLHNLGL